jgi:hypothetical protein
MKRNVGLWIDHRKAVIVIVTDEGEETELIESGMEKHVRFASGSDEDGSGGGMRGRPFSKHPRRYHDRVL